MSSKPGLQRKPGFGTKKGKARLVERSRLSGKKRAAKPAFFKGTGSGEKLCCAFSSLLQAVKAAKAEMAEGRNTAIAAADAQAGQKRKHTDESGAW